MGDSLQHNKEHYSFSIFNSQEASTTEKTSLVDTTESITYISLEDIFSVFKAEKVERESLFVEHCLQKKSEEKLLTNKQESPPWVFAILITISILFCWIFSSYRFRVSQMFRACFSNRHMNMLMKEGNMLKGNIIFPIAITYLPLLSLLIYKIIDHYSSNTLNYTVYMLILAGLTLFTVLKFFIIQFLGNVFKSSYISTIYLVNDLVFNLFISIVLFPLLFVVFFSHTNSYDFPIIGVFIIVCIVYLFKIMRGFTLTLINSKFSKLYLFYYLCSVEIIPILIIGKLLISAFRN